MTFKLNPKLNWTYSFIDLCHWILSHWYLMGFVVIIIIIIIVIIIIYYNHYIIIIITIL